MGGVEEGRSVVGVEIAAVHRRRGGRALGDAAGAEEPAAVRHRLAPGVVGIEVQPVPQPLLERRLQRVVVRNPPRRRRDHERDVGVERVERTTLLRRQPGAGRAGARQRLVGVDGHDDVLRVAAHVADIDRRSRSEQILAEQIPLMRELRPNIGIPRAKLSRGRSSACNPSKPVANVPGPLVLSYEICDSKKNGVLSVRRWLAPVPSMYCVIP